MTQTTERRLAAILAADVVGYSRLMSADEAGTHARLRTLHREVVEPKVAEHRGRVVKLIGDGVLAEFPSVVDAVSCAVEIQRGMAERADGTASNEQIRFRIGVNLGDVIFDEDDIYGDGVNIAARLEGLAGPGGICISPNVHEEVKNKLGFGYQDLGPQQVKNIPEPVRAFRVLADPHGAAPATAPMRQRRRWTWPGVAGTLTLVVVATGVLTWLRPSHLDLPSTELARIAAPPEIANKPSVAVLPFENRTGNPDKAHLVDGLVEDIIAELSRATELLVTARSSTFALKGQPINVREVSKDLGVRYLVEGSVQRADERLGVTVQLIDAASGHHIATER